MNNKNQKLVSVIIPTYKRPTSLKRTIDSVIGQTYNNIEIIVVDDNNPNTKYRKETEKLMDSYSSFPKVIYLKHEKNKNGSAARNTGFRISKGEYLMFLDDDDEFLPEKVTSQIDCLEEKNSDWGLSYTKYLRIDNNSISSKSGETRSGNLLVDALGRNLFIHAGSNLMIRRKVFQEVNGFDETFLRNQDLELLTRILENYKIAFVDVLGLKVHIHKRENKIDFSELTDQYLLKFKSNIDLLISKDKEKVCKLINLQLFRNKLCHIKTWNEAFIMILNKKISLFISIKYLMHLVFRKITKKSIGFRL